MVILSSPSGVGKTTITKKLQQKYQNFKVSISHTTRPPRSNEVNGVDYNFVSIKEFKQLIKENKFYEYAKIFENYYGTLKKNKFYEYAKIFENYYGTLKENVDNTILKHDILFDIDWQGTKQLSKFKNLNLIKIFLITENKKELRNRLLKRNQNTKDEIDKRFNSFEEDIKHWNDYDYIVINKNLEVCFKQIENIILNKKKSYLSLFK